MDPVSKSAERENLQDERNVKDDTNGPYYKGRKLEEFVLTRKYITSREMRIFVIGISFMLCVLLVCF